MSLPRNNLIHDQDMDEIRFFISRFGYDPRAPPQWVHPIDVPQPSTQPIRRRHPDNIRDTRSPRRNNGGKRTKRKSNRNKRKSRKNK